MIFETVCVGMMQANCYVLAEGKESQAIIIDPGDEEGKIRKVLDRNKLKPGLVVNTHGHIDHIGCDDRFAVPVCIHKKDLPLLKEPRLNLSSLFGAPFSVNSQVRLLEDGQSFGLGTLELEVIHVPGHTPGGIALLLKSPKGKILFTGDSLFCQGIGRTDFPGASEPGLIESIRKRLFVLADDVAIYPGHGPASSIGAEKRDNPFFNR
jgi:glyoxylase-like metal-dependent hydrolase (beta-lactamase superfamily II)